MTAILIGCDPEVFVKQQGIFKSAYGLIRGDKANPFKIRNGAVQVDGMALEFNIDPAATPEQFVFNVKDVFDQMCRMVPDYEVTISPVAHFDYDYMQRQPQEALELGCDPDYNAWERRANIKPNSTRPMRTASGHVHIGWGSGFDAQSQEHMSYCAEVTKQMDFFLGLPSLFYDDDLLRREMYGKAGCFRSKHYGMEYRTLSNAWLKSDDLMQWVFEAAKKSYEEFLNGRILADIHGDIQRIINESDKEAAMNIIQQERLELPKCLK